MDIGVPFCGAAKTSLHNQVFLEGVKSALYAAVLTSSAGIAKPDLHTTGKGGRLSFPPNETKMGLKALGRVYVCSQEFEELKLCNLIDDLGW